MSDRTSALNALNMPFRLGGISGFHWVVAASVFAAFLVWGGGTEARAQACVAGTGPNSLSCGTGVTASGDDSTAIGDNSVASGIESTAIGQSADATKTDATALGNDAQATGFQSTAIGDDANASALDSTAIGQDAAATGTHSTALGADALASGSGSTALGDFSTVFGDGAVAIGISSTASGVDAVAIGNGANANFSNSTALGAGAATTRADQVSIGTSTNTYTMAGITSAASQSAQSGPTELVTTDAAGNLATDGGSTLAGIGLNTKAINKNSQGVAMAMAMENPDLVGGESYGISVNVGEFSGEIAIAMGLMGVLGRNLLGPNRGRIAVGGSVGLSDDETAGRVGLQFTF